MSRELNAGELRALLSYDSASGEFAWLECRSGGAPQVGQKAGTVEPSGYKTVRIGRRRFAAHRLAWLHVYGQWPTREIDHINGDRGDNRIANLRDVDRATNNRNRRLTRSSTGIPGAHVKRGTTRFTASISVGNRSRHIGTFATAAEAGAAYQLARQNVELEAL